MRSTSCRRCSASSSRWLHHDGTEGREPGGFYSFVCASLGEPAGLGDAFLATFGYTAIGFSAPALFAVTRQGYVVGLSGPSIPRYWIALAIVAGVTALPYRRIDVSTKVLSAVMVFEVVVVVVFGVVSLVTGYGAGRRGGDLTLPWVSDANIGLALLFVIGSFFGFEATVIYREEVEDPRRTTPRATAVAVGGIGLSSAVAAWASLPSPVRARSGVQRRGTRPVSSTRR
nr:amino acid permease [Kineococcus aurantiacus]